MQDLSPNLNSVLSTGDMIRCDSTRQDKTGQGGTGTSLLRWHFLPEKNILKSH